ncbi:MAG: glycosyltransferase family 4 protein [Acidobacteria bacterium]|jgi:glycosyltransferase involved in cell wall biosynthesis|nr:glycosyltransferase family 4 protein [Acidobacteriota bacterium]
MHIHLVTDKFHLGGGLEHIFQITRGLKDMRFRIFGEPCEREAIKKFKSLENVEVHDRGYQPSIVLEKKADFIHFHHLRPLMAFFKNPFRKYDMPIIFTAHGLHIHKYEFYHTRRARMDYGLRFILEKRLLAKADRVISVSHEDKSFLETKYDLKNVTYLTNGIDFSAASAVAGKFTGKKTWRQKLGLPVDDFLFVTVARFHFQKGYDILLKAIALAREKIKAHGVRFVLIGDGPEFEQIKKLSWDLGISTFIIFLGARTDVYDFLKASDVFLLPSRWEGLPIVLLEAGFLKVPVIASDTYGNREIIKKDNGILFQNLDSGALAGVIQEVLENKYHLDSYSENLYNEVLAEYNLERMLTGLRKIYE